MRLAIWSTTTPRENSGQAEADQHGDEVQSKQQERGTPHAIDTSSGQWDRTQHSRVVEAAEQGRCNSEL